MNRNLSPAVPLSRRERRIAARRVHSEERTRPSVRSRWRSPIALITGGALLAGLIGIGALQLMPSNSAAPAHEHSAGIFVPTDLPPADLTDGRSLGRADAPVTLTIWSDFQCPACRMLAREIEPRLVSEYVATGKLRIEYRDLIVIGPESIAAAAASRCAADQDRFWDYHGLLFANQLPENSGGITRDRLISMAGAIDLDEAAFAGCLDSDHGIGPVESESASGKSRAQATPTLDFGSVVIPGVPTWAALSAQIDDLVAAATS